MVEVLTKMGYKQNKIEPCLFNKGMSFIDTYVDDLVICEPKINEINSIKCYLMNQFKMTDLGELKYLLGVQILRDKSAKTLTLHQQNYTKVILKKFNMQ